MAEIHSLSELNSLCSAITFNLAFLHFHSALHVLNESFLIRLILWHFCICGNDFSLQNLCCQ